MSIQRLFSLTLLPVDMTDRFKGEKVKIHNSIVDNRIWIGDATVVFPRATSWNLGELSRRLDVHDENCFRNSIWMGDSTVAFAFQYLYTRCESS